MCCKLLCAARHCTVIAFSRSYTAGRAIMCTGCTLLWAFALTQPYRVQRLAVLSVGFPGGLVAVDMLQQGGGSCALLSCFPASCRMLPSRVLSLHAYACSALNNFLTQQVALLSHTPALTQPDRVQRLAVLSVGFPGGLVAVDMLQQLQQQQQQRQRRR
jgi:pimeloyl-ACP methyl ester carboxylesterase